MRSFVRRLILVCAIPCASVACGSNDASNPWVGKTYLIDTPSMPEAYWTVPKKAGGYIGAFVPQLLISVEGGSGDELRVTLGTAINGEQDLCSPTTQVTSSAARYPQSTIEVPSFPMRIVNPNPKRGNVVFTTVHDVVFEDVLPGEPPPDDGTLTATVDFQEVYPLVNLLPDPTKDEACDLFQKEGGFSCQTCSFNQEPYCVTVKAVEILGTLTSTRVVTVAEDQIASSCR
jgi:hypothetical protein